MTSQESVLNLPFSAKNSESMPSYSKQVLGTHQSMREGELVVMPISSIRETESDQRQTLTRPLAHDYNTPSQ